MFAGEQIVITFREETRQIQTTGKKSEITDRPQFAMMVTKMNVVQVYAGQTLASYFDHPRCGKRTSWVEQSSACRLGTSEGAWGWVACHKGLGPFP